MSRMYKLFGKVKTVEDIGRSLRKKGIKTAHIDVRQNQEDQAYEVRLSSIDGARVLSRHYATDKLKSVSFGGGPIDEGRALAYALIDANVLEQYDIEIDTSQLIARAKGIISLLEPLHNLGR